MASRIPQPGAEAAGGGSGAVGHHLHHQREPAGRDLVDPVLPFLRGGGDGAQFARRTDDHDGRPGAVPPAVGFGPHGQPSGGGEGRSDRRQELQFTFAEVPAGSDHARRTPADTIGEEDHPELLIETQRPEDLVQPGAAPAITGRQVGQSRHRRTASGQRGEAVRLGGRGVLRLGQQGLVLGRDPVVATDHGADHQRLRIDRGPAGDLVRHVAVDQPDRFGVQLTDPESGGGQRRDVSAGTVGPLLPHPFSMAPPTASGIPRFVGSIYSRRSSSVVGMTHLVQHTAAGEGSELTAPDAVLTVKIDAAHTDGAYEVFEVDAPRGPATPLHRTGWGKAYYVLQGRMIVQIEDEGFDLGPGSSVTIPPNALHTFTVLSPSATFLAISLTGAMGRFHADLDAHIPTGDRWRRSCRRSNRSWAATT